MRYKLKISSRSLKELELVVKFILDEYRIAGGRKVDYYTLARKLARELYSCKGVDPDVIAKGIADHYKKAYELRSEVVDLIVEAAKKIVEKEKQRDAELEEGIKKILRFGLGEEYLGEYLGGKKAGDNSSREAVRASGEG